VQGLKSLYLYPGTSFFVGDGDFTPVTVAPDEFMGCVLGRAMRLPLQLRSLVLSLDSASFSSPLRMQPLLGALAGALGDRLTELIVCLRFYEGYASDALLCLPMFVRLESLTLGTWTPFDAEQPAKLAGFRALLARFRAVRAGMPLLREAAFEVAYLDGDAPHADPGQDPFDALRRDFRDIHIGEHCD
jgi:hypothetical protein